MIRTLKFALHYQPANSQAIGYYATQQNAAYNAAVDVLNQEPDLPKRSGRHHPDALNKRITAWRQRNRQRADAPYYIHQQGAEEAWEANQRMQQARDDRQQRIAQAIANGEEPKQRDIRPHRRTLAHRARKKGPLSLTITDRRLFQVSNESQTLSSRQCGFTVTLRAHQNPKFLDIRSIRLVPVKNYGTRTPLGRRHYCLHVQVAVPEPIPIESVDIENPEDILGADRGTKNHLAVSSGHRAHNPRSGKQRTRRRKHQHDIAGKPRGSKRRHHAVAKAREQSRSLHPATRPRPPPANPRHPAGSKAQDGRRREPAPNQHDGVRPWHQRSTGQERRRQTQTQRKPRRVSNRLRGKAPTRRSRQTRDTHHLRPTAGHVPDLPALRRPAPEQPREPSGVPVSELRSQSPRRLDCCRHHSQPDLRPALRMAVRLYTGRTDRTHRVARAAIRLRATTTAFRLGAKRVQAGRHRDEFPREQGPWPKAGPPYSSGEPRRQKCYE